MSDPKNIVSTNNQRIAKNATLLYFRMILLMAVSLYTSRIVLSTLGIEDYGIYNVVGGFIGMLAFLNGAMCGCTQRFITFALGKGDKQELKKIFSTTLITHAIIALLVFVLAETVGLWFVIEKLVIPPDRFVAAMIVYQCSVASALIMIMSFPYNADIIAHERMSAFAYISIVEAFLKLAIVFILPLGGIDKLILYAILLLIVQLGIRSIYTWYCKKHFAEANFTWYFDKSLIKEILSFSGWNLWGGLAATLFGQGVNVLLNIFFGPTVNAARGIAMQVQGAVQQFSTNFQMALNPQITKNYATGDINAMHTLIFRCAKFTFMLLLCIILPISMEIDFILSIWLKDVPEYTCSFVILMLAICIIDAVSNPFMTASAATGHVRVYQFVVGLILILIVPSAYLVLKLGGAPLTVFIVHLCWGIVAFIARLFIVRPLIHMSIRKYIISVMVPCSIVLLTSLIICYLLKIVLPETNISSVIKIVTSGGIVIIMSYLFGLTKSERFYLTQKALRRLNVK